MRQRRYRFARRAPALCVTHQRSPSDPHVATVREIGAATVAAPPTPTRKDHDEIFPLPSDGAGAEHHESEPRCDFCGRFAGRFTRFDFLPPPRRMRRRIDLPRDRPG
jgi:hypothetical protein